MRTVAVEIEYDGEIETVDVEIDTTESELMLAAVSRATGIEEHDLGYLTTDTLAELFVETLDEAFEDVDIDVPDW